MTGVTGTAAAQADLVRPEVERIRAQTDLPVIVGFGIKTREASQNIARLCDGTVVGSAIVERIGRGDSVSDVLEFVSSLAEGAHS
jgi:tryptophan synthase alpha chain